LKANQQKRLKKKEKRQSIKFRSFEFKILIRYHLTFI